MTNDDISNCIVKYLEIVCERLEVKLMSHGIIRAWQSSIKKKVKAKANPGNKSKKFLFNKS